MRSMIRFECVLTLLLCLGSISLSGCGEQQLFDYARVSGTVTLDGNPLPEVTVIFVPKGDGKSAITGELSAGKTDSEGRFTLKTPSGRKGAKVDTHAVLVVDEDENPDPNQKMRKISRVPKRYSEEGTLTFEVSNRGTRSADFPLVSK
ncbi:MAG TPA: hypothetical protein VNQ76_09225 [Planctomicrobium sp.]|nr:hypothetical protein [Planctomicrobium sp.]